MLFIGGGAGESLIRKVAILMFYVNQVGGLLTITVKGWHFEKRMKDIAMSLNLLLRTLYTTLRKHFPSEPVLFLISRIKRYMHRFVFLRLDQKYQRYKGECVVCR